ncbi:unnamed protein product [Closterium sp. Naga37s-1]|nr:unnamed protein product [Closterium sp. Naga37s-1]
MPSRPFWCHQCATVRSLTAPSNDAEAAEVICAWCGGGFVEELTAGSEIDGGEHGRHHRWSHRGSDHARAAAAAAPVIDLTEEYTGNAHASNAHAGASSGFAREARESSFAWDGESAGDADVSAGETAGVAAGASLRPERPFRGFVRRRHVGVGADVRSPGPSAGEAAFRESSGWGGRPADDDGRVAAAAGVVSRSGSGGGGGATIGGPSAAAASASAAAGASGEAEEGGERHGTARRLEGAYLGLARMLRDMEDRVDPERLADVAGREATFGAAYGRGGLGGRAGGAASARVGGARARRFGGAEDGGGGVAASLLGVRGEAEASPILEFMERRVNREHTLRRLLARLESLNAIVGGQLLGGGAAGGIEGAVGDYFFGDDFDALVERISADDAVSTRNPPACPAAVEAMLVRVVTAADVAQREAAGEGEHGEGGGLMDPCAICKDDYDAGAVTRQMPCRHVYHSDCILPWLQRHNTCPVCRFELPTADAQDAQQQGQGRGAEGAGGTGAGGGAEAGGGGNSIGALTTLVTLGASSSARSSLPREAGRAGRGGEWEGRTRWGWGIGGDAGGSGAGGGWGRGGLGGAGWGLRGGRERGVREEREWEREMRREVIRTWGREGERGSERESERESMRESERESERESVRGSERESETEREQGMNMQWWGGQGWPRGGRLVSPSALRHHRHASPARPASPALAAPEPPASLAAASTGGVAQRAQQQGREGQRVSPRAGRQAGRGLWGGAGQRQAWAAVTGGAERRGGSRGGGESSVSEWGRPWEEQQQSGEQGSAWWRQAVAEGAGHRWAGGRAGGRAQGGQGGEEQRQEDGVWQGVQNEQMSAGEGVAGGVSGEEGGERTRGRWVSEGGGSGGWEWEAGGTSAGAWGMEGGEEQHEEQAEEGEEEEIEGDDVEREWQVDELDGGEGQEEWEEGEGDEEHVEEEEEEEEEECEEYYDDEEEDEEGEEEEDGEGEGEEQEEQDEEDEEEGGDEEGEEEGKEQLFFDSSADHEWKVLQMDLLDDEFA